MFRPGVGGTFIWGGSAPKFNPIPFRIPFGRKGTPFVYLLLANGTPFPYPVYDFPSLLNCSKGAVFKIWINHKNRTFSRLFHSHEVHLLALLGLYRPKWQISSPFHILQQVKFIPFYIPEAWKRYTFRAEPPGISHYREYPHGCLTPPPPPGHLQETYTHTLNQCNLQSSMLIRSDTKTYHNLQKNTPWPPCDTVNDLHTMAQALRKASKT